MPDKAVTAAAGGVRINVKAAPGSRRNRIVGWLGDALKIAVAAPPEGGRANRAICALLAEALGVKAHQVQVVAGAASARKRIFVAGLTVEQAQQRLGPTAAERDEGRAARDEG